MTDTLDEKLHTLPLATVVKENGSVWLSDKDIAQIKQAFADANYVQIPVVTEQPDKTLRVNGKQLMAGQEWYDRVDKAELRKSINNMASTFNQFTGGDRATELLYPLIDKQLKRASGIE